MAAVDIFIKFDGILGESLDHKHKDEIVLESFSWGESNTGAHAATGGAGAGKVSMQDFHFTARVSKASPKLMMACATGQHIKTGVVTLRKTQSENQFEFLFIKFDTVVITSVQDAGDTNNVPLEQVSFAFAKINVEYKEQKADGSLGATVDFAWNLAANRKD
ncbi:MAG TPA: type VI secretion system tube protein Hcp [Candidatus Dormibacteraeota bacterium]|nr:type VI secretion system tube protein Hcp [Candidatus Dormibacteraeota bacterium]